MFRMSTPSYTWTFGTLWVLNGLKPKAERYFPENKNISGQKLSVTIKRGANYNYEKWYIIVCVVCKRIKSWCSYFQFGETFFVNIYAFFFVRNRNFSERFFFSLLEIERSGLYTFTVVRKQNGLRTVLSDGGNSISSISMGVVPRETSENFVFFFRNRPIARVFAKTMKYTSQINLGVRTIDEKMFGGRIIRFRDELSQR